MLLVRRTLNSPYDRSPGQAFTQSFPGFDSIQDDLNLQTSLGLTHTFSPTVLNETLVGYVRFSRDRVSQDAGQRNWVQELGIQGFSPDELTWGAPSVTPTGYPEVGYSTNNAVLRWITQAMQLSDNLSIVRSKHTLKVGFSLQSKRLSQFQLSNPTGAYGFSGMFSAPPPVTTTTRFHSIADLLLGYPSFFPVTPPARNAD